MNYIKYEEVRENIAVVTIDRQEALNALNLEVITELDEMIAELEKKTDLRAVILTGAGRSFVAGADIAVQSVLDYEGGLKWGQNGSRIFRRLEVLPVPVIAAVNGFALGGGCELALSCDIILAAGPNAEGKGGAKFGQPEVGLGITPGFSGTQRLARKVGSLKAKELIFTGGMIGAAEAERIGLVNKVVAPEALMDEAIKMAEAIAKNAPIAVKLSKQAINSGCYDMNLEDGIALENELFAQCFRTEDQKAGMQAFLNKEKAVFQNK